MKRIAFVILPLALVLTTVAEAQQAVPTSADNAALFSDAPYGVAYESAPSAGGGRSTEPEAVLLVPSPGMSEQQRRELTADLDIMCALFDRLLGDAGLTTCTWGPRVGRYRRSTRSLYLPGFGALFFLEVGFPLIAPATTETSPDRETTDALWAEVRENMRSQGRPGRHSTQRTRAHYDNLKVESLQRMLHRAVTHCANLRQLAPDDQIIALAINASSTRTGGLYFDAAGAYGSYYSPSSASGGAAPADVLAVKTTKKEVDALARGQVSPADFQERVQTLTYELPLLQAQSLPQPR